jgi:CubicO group peptidase (beta-lactamase class C family)
MRSRVLRVSVLAFLLALSLILFGGFTDRCGKLSAAEPDEDIPEGEGEPGEGAEKKAEEEAEKADEPETLEDRCAKAADYSAGNKGCGVIVMVGGKVVFERYDNGGSKTKAVHIGSATQGFWGPAAAAMLEDKLITSFDELATYSISEWKDDPKKSKITIRHLLTLTAGLDKTDKGFDGGDLYKRAIGLEAVAEPGAEFQYGPGQFFALGAIMKK